MKIPEVSERTGKDWKDRKDRKGQERTGKDRKRPERAGKGKFSLTTRMRGETRTTIIREYAVCIIRLKRRTGPRCEKYAETN